MKRVFNFRANCYLIIFFLFLGQLMKSQEYDVGIFYMPLWQNNLVPDVPNTGQWRAVPHHFGKPGENNLAFNHAFPNDFRTYRDMMDASHWEVVNEFDSYLINNGLTGSWDNYSKVSSPLGIWYVDKPDVNGFGLYDSPAYWYNETVREVVEKQASLMKNYGIDYVIYDWFFNFCRDCYNHNVNSNVIPAYNSGMWFSTWEQTVQQWLKPNFNDHGLEMALYWANDFNFLVDLISPNDNIPPNLVDKFFQDGLSKMLDRMADFMALPNYKEKEGKKVLYIYFPAFNDWMSNPLMENHSFFNSFVDRAGVPNEIDRMKFFMDYMDNYIHSKIGKNIYFISESRNNPTNTDEDLTNTVKLKEFMIDYPMLAGFNATTSYRMTFFDMSDKYDWGQPNDSNEDNNLFEEQFNHMYDYNTMIGVFSKFYNFHKNRISLSSNFKYHVPVTEGWNRSSQNMRDAGGENQQYTPLDGGIRWNVSQLRFKSFTGLKNNEFKASIDDQAESTPTQWGMALSNAKNFIDANSVLTDNTVTLCCWNEHTEGTVIEPTFAWGYSYLQKVKDYFEDTEMGIEPDPQGPLYPLQNFESLNESTIPDSLFISQNEPNPFSEETKLNYGLPNDGYVNISILSLDGKIVKEILKGQESAGHYESIVELDNVTNGVYFVRLSLNGESKSIKIVLNK